MGSSNRPSYSCVRCSERKVKCDRNQPCRACAKRSVDCIYRALPTSKGKRNSPSHEALHRQVLEYEDLLRQKGVDITSSTDVAPQLEIQVTDLATTTTAQSAIPARPAQTSRKAKPEELSRVESRHGFVGNSLMTRVVEEVDKVESEHDDTYPTSSDPEENDEASDLALGRLRSNHSFTDELSSYQLHALWDFFKSNVDPLTKVVHVPSLQQAFMRAAERPSETSKTFRSLFQAICSAAIMSMHEDDCQSVLGLSQQSALEASVRDTRRSLSAARFMGSSNIVVLQALVLHILAVRDTQDSRTNWNLVGIAIRTAQSLGLQYNGEDLKLSPYDSEIRRRIWWFLKMHDARAAELCGGAKFSGFADDLKGIKTIVNCDDAQLWPGLEALPRDKAGASDAMFCALKVDFAAFFVALPQTKRGAKFGPDLNADKYIHDEDLEMKLELNAKIQKMYQQKYAPYCDPLKPLHLFSMLFMRYSAEVGELFTHHFRNWKNPGKMSDTARKEVWNICVQLLEHFQMLQTSPHLHQFAWYMSWYLQWISVIYVLDVLSASPNMEFADKVWTILETIYTAKKQVIMDLRRPIHLAVGGLCLKAWAAREAAAKSLGNTIPTPAFIASIHQRMQDIRTQRKKRAKKFINPDAPIAADSSNRDYSDKQQQTEVLPDTSSFGSMQEGLYADDQSFSAGMANDFGNPDYWLFNNNSFEESFDWMQLDSLMRM